MKADIVISGGSFSAPAAALAAARACPDAEILLVEPTDWLGGQATSQGVSAIDNAWFDPPATLMREHPGDYYPRDYFGFLERLAGSGAAGAPGCGLAPKGCSWVSRETYDPRSAAWVLDRMIEGIPRITALTMTVVKKVESSTTTDADGPGRIITRLTLIRRTPHDGYRPFDKFLSREIADWFDPADSAHFAKATIVVEPRDATRGLVVIDASELGDVVVLSGAASTVGRELSTEELLDNGSMPPTDETGSQATVYPFCMTGHPCPCSEDQLKTPFADFDAYYRQQRASYFSFGKHDWNTIWTYRRLKTNAPLNDIHAVSPDDVTMQNWYPGNDYPYGSIFKTAAAAAEEAGDWRGGILTHHLAGAEKLAIAWYFHLKEKRPTDWDTLYLRGEHPLNMMGTSTGLSKFPYIRCTRRIIGLGNFRLLARYLVDTESPDYRGGTSFRFFDSVGIGNYAVDIHPTLTSTGIRPPFEKAAPFYIPYRALGSANVRNLLAAGKLIATTYVTNSAYRVHPIEWAIGSAAGAAAGLMHRHGRTNVQLLDSGMLRELQTEVNRNSPISWAAYDPNPLPPHRGDLVVNDLRPVRREKPFRVEVFRPGAVRAQVRRGNQLLGETSRLANGRLLLENARVADPGTGTFEALCYDTAGNLFDTLRA